MKEIKNLKLIREKIKHFKAKVKAKDNIECYAFKYIIRHTQGRT